MPLISYVGKSYVHHKRHPVLIQQLDEALPYPPDIRRALDELLAETLDGGDYATRSACARLRPVGDVQPALPRPPVDRRPIPVDRELLLPAAAAGRAVLRT